MQDERQGPLGQAVFPAAPVTCGEQLFRAEGEKEAESTPSPGGLGGARERIQPGASLLSYSRD